MEKQFIRRNEQPETQNLQLAELTVGKFALLSFYL